MGEERLGNVIVPGELLLIGESPENAHAGAEEAEPAGKHAHKALRDRGTLAVKADHIEMRAKDAEGHLTEHAPEEFVGSCDGQGGARIAEEERSLEGQESESQPDGEQEKRDEAHYQASVKNGGHGAEAQRRDGEIGAPVELTCEGAAGRLGRIEFECGLNGGHLTAGG